MAKRSAAMLAPDTAGLRHATRKSLPARKILFIDAVPGAESFLFPGGLFISQTPYFGGFGNFGWPTRFLSSEGLSQQFEQAIYRGRAIGGLGPVPGRDDLQHALLGYAFPQTGLDFRFFQIGERIAPLDVKPQGGTGAYLVNVLTAGTPASGECKVNALSANSLLKIFH